MQSIFDVVQGHPKQMHSYSPGGEGADWRERGSGELLSNTNPPGGPGAMQLGWESYEVGPPVDAAPASELHSWAVSLAPEGQREYWKNNTTMKK